MPFDITNFRQQLVHDGARPNLFEVTIPTPQGLVRGNAPFGSRKATFQVKGAELPAGTIGVIPIMYFGREFKVAGNRTFADWTTTVLNDDDFSVRDMLEDWMSKINEHAENVRSFSDNSPSRYQRNLLVSQYSKSGEVVKEYTIVHAWPSNIDPIPLAWETNDAIEEYAVTWTYSWWEARTTDGRTTRPEENAVSP